MSTLSDTPTTGIRFDAVLDRLQGVRRTTSGAMALCPAHNDKDPSLSISEGEGGRVLLKCHAGCSYEEIQHALGLGPNDISRDERQAPTACKSESVQATGGRPELSTSPESEPVTVSALAEKTALPEEYLRQLGLRDNPSGRVAVPYFDAGGREIMIKWRASLNGKPKYNHNTGDSARVYGLNWLAQREDKCFVVLVEGESCTWTLLHYDYPVLGIPGASNAEKLELVHIRDVPYIYIVQERDDAGCQFVDGLSKRLRALHWVGDVFILQPPEGIKDTNDWYKSDPDGFRSCFEKALEDAAPLDYFPDPFKGAILDCGSFLQEDIRRPNNLLGDGVLTEGCLAVLYGVPGTGKSWALLQQAVAIATGSEWFGLPTVRTRVAYLNLELPGYYLKERVQTILRASEIPDDLFLISQPFLTGRINVLDPDHILGFKRMIKNHGIRLLILDAFSRIHTVDEISGQQMGEVMGACDELRFETKSAVELCHHERKGQTSRGSAGDSDIDALRGHSRLLSDPQTLIRLREVKKRKRLAFTKLNLGPPVDGIWLARREDGTFEVTEEPPDQSMEREENAEALENAGREAGATGLTVAEAMDFLPHKRKKRATQNLLEELKFRKSGSGPATRWIWGDGNESRR